MVKHDEYRTLLSALYPLCKSQEFYIEPIPTFVFDAMTRSAGFLPGICNPADFDYSRDPDKVRRMDERGS